MDEKVQEISRQRPTYLPTWVERDNKAEKEFENWKQRHINRERDIGRAKYTNKGKQRKRERETQVEIGIGVNKEIERHGLT